MQILGRLFIVGLALQVLSVTSAVAQSCPDPSSSLMWEVEGNNSKIHLFGSLHLGDASFYPLHQTIENAFRKADHIVFEVDPASLADGTILAQIQRDGMLGPDETLADYISDPVLKDLEARLTKLGLPAEAYMRFRPWFLTLTLSSLQMTSLGYVPEYGVEQYLLREMPESSSVLALESITEQMDLLRTLDGESYLAYTLSSFDSSEATLEALVQAWRCADKKVLEDILIGEFENKHYPGVDLAKLKLELLDRRNQSMAEKITRYLEQGTGSYFVVIGAAHYLGEKSIIDLLEERQYPVLAVELN